MFSCLSAVPSVVGLLGICVRRSVCPVHVREEVVEMVGEDEVGVGVVCVFEVYGGVVCCGVDAL